MKSYVLTLVVLTSSCGGGAKTSSTEADLSIAETVSIEVGVNEDQEALGLAAVASAFSLDVNSCTSGFSATATAAAPTLTLYKGDTGCLGKLTSFTVNGITFAGTNPGATAFAAYAVGSTATYTDATGASKMKVLITAQLSSPLLVTDTITYSFSATANGGSGTVSQSALGEAHTVAVAGDLIPNFRIDAITFQGLNASGGGQFSFKLECLDPIVTGASASCSNLLFTDLSYVLVKDTYAGNPSASQLAALFPGTAVVAGDVTTTTTNSKGGFISSTLSGPNQLAANPDMLLVLKNGTSYQYFTITAQTL